MSTTIAAPQYNNRKCNAMTQLAKRGGPIAGTDMRWLDEADCWAAHECLDAPDWIPQSGVVHSAYSIGTYQPFSYRGNGREVL